MTATTSRCAPQVRTEGDRWQRGNCRLGVPHGGSHCHVCCFASTLAHLSGSLHWVPALHLHPSAVPYPPPAASVIQESGATLPRVVAESFFGVVAGNVGNTKVRKPKGRDAAWDHRWWSAAILLVRSWGPDCQRRRRKPCLTCQRLPHPGHMCACRWRWWWAAVSTVLAWFQGGPSMSWASGVMVISVSGPGSRRWARGRLWCGGKGAGGQQRPAHVVSCCFRLISTVARPAGPLPPSPAPRLVQTS